MSNELRGGDSLGAILDGGCCFVGYPALRFDQGARIVAESVKKEREGNIKNVQFMRDTGRSLNRAFYENANGNR